jgi:hypothetical protein
MTETVSPKVDLINRINHEWHKISGENIDADQFDYLYEQDEADLNMYLNSMKIRAQLKETMLRQLDRLNGIKEGED